MKFFFTVFAEVEGFLNARQLTYIPYDADDIESRTPNHFLLGRSEVNVALGIYKITATLTKQWQYAKILVLLLDRYLKEFVPSSRQRENRHTNHVF